MSGEHLLWQSPSYETLARQEAEDRQRVHQRYKAAANPGLAMRLADLSAAYPNLGAGPLMGAALAGWEPDDPRLAELAIRSTQLDIEALQGHRAMLLEQAEGRPFWQVPLDLFKGAVRTTFMAFETAWEEGLMRPLRTAVGVYQGMSLEEAYGAAGASTGLRALQTALRDPWGSFTPAASDPDAEVNVGSGFFAGGDLAPETERMLAQGTPIDQAWRNPAQMAMGEPLGLTTRHQRETGIQITSRGGVKVPVSPGRLLAITIAEPGSTTFNVVSGLADFAANIALDPANLALARLAKSNTAMRQILEPNLLTDAARKVTMPRTLATGFESNAGRAFLDDLAAAGDQLPYHTFHRALARSQGALDPKVSLNIYDAVRTRDPAAIRDAFLAYEPHLTTEPWRQSRLGRILDTQSGTALGAPVSRAVGRYGVPTAVQAGAGAVVGAATAGQMDRDPFTGALLGAAAGAISSRGLTRMPGGGDIGSFLGRTQSAGVAVTYSAKHADTYLAWLGTKVGARGISVRDKAQGALDLEDHLRLLRLPDTEIDQYVQRLVRAEGMPEVLGVVGDAYQSWGRTLIAEGIPKEAVDRITRLYTKDWQDFKQYWLDLAGKHHVVPGGTVRAAVGRNIEAGPSAFLMSELVEQWVPILDAKKVRAVLRRTNDHSIISKKVFTDWDTIGERALIRGLDSFMDQVWKPLVLLRIAWPVRVIGEEQIRMAMMGLDSAISHPIQYLSMVISGSDSKWLDNLFSEGRPKNRDVLGNMMRLSDEERAVRSSRQAWFGRADYTDPHTGEFTARRWGDGEWRDGWMNRTRLLTRDPVAREVARAARAEIEAGRSIFGEPRFLAAVKQSYRDGDLSVHRRQKIADGGRHSILIEDAAADQVVDHVWAQMVEHLGIDNITREGWGVFPNRRLAASPTTGKDLSAVVATPRGPVLTPKKVRYRDSFGRTVSDERVGRMRVPGRATDGPEIPDITGMSRTDLQAVATARLRELADAPPSPRVVPDPYPVDLSRSPGMILPEGSIMPPAEYLDLIADDVWTYIDEAGRRRTIKQVFMDDAATGKRAYLDRTAKDYAQRKSELTRRIVEHLDEKMLDKKGERLLRRVVVSHPISKIEGDQRGSWDKITDWLFDHLMGQPTDTLSRSPAFEQFYWRRMARLMPYLSPQDARRALKQLRGSNPRRVSEWATDVLKGDDATLDMLHRFTDDAFDMRAWLKNTADESIEGVGRISLDDADSIAKGFALTEVRDLLYDVSRKHNFFDMARHIFPFGEAWKEIISRWANIVHHNPRVLRRVDQTISAARDTGFFYNDPVSGEEVFTYPGSGLLSQWMFGDADVMRMTGRVAGFNLMLGAVIPGVGPAIQVPAAALQESFLSNPDNKFLRDMLLPFGLQEVDSPGSLVDTILPAWIKRLAVVVGKPTGDDQRVFNNTVIDVMRVMVETGQADIGTPQGFADAFESATNKARFLYFVRAGSALAGPTPAAPRFYAEDTGGRLWAFSALATEYRRLLEEHQGSEYLATQAFTALYGLDASLYITPKSRSLRRRSTTESGAAFEARNPDLFELFPRTAYYTRPDDPDEEFDYGAYVKQLRGEMFGDEPLRQALSPEQWAQERNDLLGRIAYHHARVMLGDARNTDQGRQYLAAYRTMLMSQYDGYNSPVLGIQQRETRDSLIAEFERWRDSPAMLETDAGQGLAMYLDYRQQAIDALVADGLSPSALRTSKRGEIYRDWLRRVGARITLLHPSFLTQWADVWSREIEEQDLEAERMMLMEGIAFNA